MKFRLSIIVFLLSIITLFAQDAAEIVSKNLEVSGGEKAWNNLNSIFLKGDVSLDVDHSYPMIIYHKRPYQKKVVFVVNNKEVLNEGYDGKNGWTYSDILKKNIVVPDYQPDAFDSDLLAYKKKGFTLKYIGEDTIDGIATYKISLQKNKNITYYYFDKKTYQLIAEDNKEELLVYSNFKKINGLTFAMKITGKPKQGGEYVVVFNDIKINPFIDDKQFKF